MSELVGGRYHLLRKLASGGMAEVFLARQQGLEGFEKLVVVKRILPAFASNPEFRRMFLDEARTAADLRHPNVVSIFDVGADQGTYFIAMEYLHGVDFAALFQKHRERGEHLPLEHVLQVMGDAAAGLHSAHTKTDLRGQPLGIVHRDVSPQNLFVTFDGTTKVLDFGIARARKRGTTTDAGVVKGKYAYLAPEALEGAELDARADLFALGIVLYELTTLTRLFARPSDAEVLRAVMEAKVPRPSSVVPNYPSALEDIVLRALARDREQRFPDCEAFRQALEQLAERRAVPHSASRVGAWLRGLLPEAFKAEPQAEPVVAPAANEPTRAEGKGSKSKTNPARGKVSRKKAASDGLTKPSIKVERLLEGAEGFLDAVQSSLGGGAGRKSNVVPPPGQFIGREDDVRALEQLFKGGARLVTIAGFGGLGKTRLSLRFAELQLPEYLQDGGAWFVDLSEARTADDICKEVERALDVGSLNLAAARETITHTGRTLKGLGRALVVLDNFEQVVPHAAATVGEWLKVAPEARFLVTTREALRLPGEKVHPLQPLQSQGVELFLARANAPVSPNDLSVVSEICRRLDGFPLAIELAAARLGQYTPRQILERLDRRFALLGGRDEGPEGRHATLWNAIDWSYQFLPKVEAAAFRQLATFRGGFTLEAAEAVLDLSEVSRAPDPFEVVEALHRKSLLKIFVAPEAPKQLRLTMLESIHAFAREKLEASGEEHQAHARHAQFFLGKGDSWAEEVHGPSAAECLATLSAERENLVEVFERAVSAMPPSSKSATDALRALNVLDALLARKGPFNSHLALLDTAIQVARSVKSNPAYLARALQQRGNVHRQRGHLQQAVADLTEAMALVKVARDLPLRGRIICDAGVAHFVSGDLVAAEADFSAALEVAREVGDLAFEVRALSFAAILHLARRDIPEALARCDEALPLTRKRGDAVSEARVLGTIGALYLEDLRFDLADAFFSEAIERCAGVGEVRLRAFFAGKRALVRLEQGQFDSARALLDDAVSVLGEVGDLRHEGLLLAYKGSLEACTRALEAAAVSFSAAEARLSSVKDPLLLTALAVRRMHLDVCSRAASVAEARALLADVRAARGKRPARVFQSEEVRLAARLLENSLST